MNAHRYHLTVTVLFILAVASANAQLRYADTFNVTVADKTPEHPYYGQGSTRGYVVNGVQSPTIVLVRDSVYLFDKHEVPINLPFSFYTIPIGGGSGFYNDHILWDYSTTTLWVVKPTDETPDTLYYASSREPWVGGTILIVDSITTSVEDDAARHAAATLAGAEAYPNPCTGETELRFVLADRSTVSVQVVDAVGRIVHSVQAGTMEQGPAAVPLRLENLASGFYLYRIDALAEGRRSVATGTVQVR